MKSKAAKSAIDIVVTLLIFGIGQLAGGIISGVIIGLNGGSHSSYSSSYLVLALLPANVVTIVLLLFSRYLLTTMKWLEKVDFIEVINPSRLRWWLAPLMLIASFAGAVASGCLANAWGVENTLEEAMLGLAKNPIGILTIVFIGPFAEELVFRHSILGGMLRRGVHPWIAIIISSLLFGIIHWNPIQIFCATVLGIMLGILYTKTQSLVPSLMYHIINNGLSVVGMILSGNGDDPTDELFNTPLVLYGVAAISALICIPAYIYYWRKQGLVSYQQPNNDEPNTPN